jgi:hypothetical protein
VVRDGLAKVAAGFDKPRAPVFITDNGAAGLFAMAAAFSLPGRLLYREFADGIDVDVLPPIKSPYE